MFLFYDPMTFTLRTNFAIETLLLVKIVVNIKQNMSNTFIL